MKILITGAAGYIGSTLTAMLASERIHKIRCFDNFFWNQQKFVTFPISLPGVEFYDEDITKWSDDLKESLAWADVVIPLAALVGAPLCDTYPELAIQLNEEWPKKMLEYVTGRVIFPNTNSSYGTQTEICTESTPLNPLSLYARTKDNAEKIILSYNNSVVFRLATVFGLSFRPRLDLLVNNLTMEAVKTGGIGIFDGHFNRNYIHVYDVCEAFDFARKGFLIPGVYNLGNDSINMSKMDLAKRIAKVTNAQVVEITGSDKDNRNYLVSSKKLYDSGFHCQYTLEDGVEEIANFIKLGVDDPCFRNY